jgi:uncharacterized membrane protein
MRASSLRSALSLAAVFGLIVSIFAMAESVYSSLRGLCSVNSFFSCALVDQSGRTTTLGIQDYFWGIAGFILILIGAALWEKRPRARWIGYGLVALTSAGVALALYFLYVELAEIHALCIVCVVTYFMGGIAWLAAIALTRKVQRGELEPDEPETAPDAEPS